MTLVVDTSAVPDREALPYWSRLIARTFAPVIVSARETEPYFGRMHIERASYLRICTIEADAATLTRTSSPIADQATESFVLVGHLLAGACEVHQDVPSITHPACLIPLGGMGMVVGVGGACAAATE